MPITELYSSTGTTISTTEISLVTGTSSLGSATDRGMFQLWVDHSNIALNDEFRIKIKEKVLSGGTQRVIYDQTILGGPQPTFRWKSPAMMLINGWDITMQKIAGTDRSISWSLRQVPNTVTEIYTGNAVTVGATPVSLVSGTTVGQSVTTDGIYQVFIDAINISTADFYQLYQLEKLVASGSQSYHEPLSEWSGVSSVPIIVTEPAILMHGWDYKLLKRSGTDRTFSWSIRQIT